MGNCLSLLRICFGLRDTIFGLLLLLRRSLPTFIGMRLLMLRFCRRNFALGLLVFGRRLGLLGRILGGLSGSTSFRRWRCSSLLGRNPATTSWNCWCGMLRICCSGLGFTTA